MLPLEKQNAYRERYRRLRPNWRTSGDEIEALVRTRLRPESRVLDVGCGRGGVMELFWREVRLAVGLDADVRSLREHRARMPLTCGLSERLPFRAATFDLAIALWVLEHLPQPDTALSEIGRVLKPGGRLLFLTPNAAHPLILANRLSQLWPGAQRALVPRLYGRAEADTFRVHYRANTFARLRHLAAACGFEVASLRAVADPSYLAFSEALFRLSVAIETWLPKTWGVHLVGEWVRK